MAVSYTINGILFKTQKDLRAHLKAMYAFYKNGDSLSKKDFNFVYDLFKHHEEYKTRIAGGVKDIKLDFSLWKGVKTRCFYIIHDDGTLEDFSYENCIKNYKP